MAVKVRPGETLDSALRRFKKEVIKAGIIQDLRKHEYYVSPSQKKRLKTEAARKRIMKKNAKAVKQY